MMHIRKAEDKEKYLLEAFNALVIEKPINWIKTEIEDQLKKFLSYLKIELRANQRIFENLESRIKGEDSFREKIYRKGYLHTWEVTDNLKNNKDLIARNLPDLIGFRITCFFWEDEASIYQLLKTYYLAGKFDKIKINFNENHHQKNGHDIYKVSGLYNDEYCFELQIKSIMHNIWGEVEHKTIYKNRDYDPNIEIKKNISEELFNILKAADKQLLTLFEETYTEEKLLRTMFFVKTKEKITMEMKTPILADHYEHFFNTFSSKDDLNNIKKYVTYSLNDKNYIRKKTSHTNSAIF